MAMEEAAHNVYRLSPEQRAVVARARAVAEDSVAAHAAAVDQDARFPEESIRALGAAGLMGLTVPQELGGLGEGLRAAAAVVDEIAQRCGSTAMVYMMHLCGVQCYLAHPERFAGMLKKAAAGEHLSTLAFSEKGSRSQFWAPVSQAVRSGEGVALSAQKSWITSAGVADGIVSSSRSTDGTGVSVWLVCKDDPGVSVSGGWNSLGMRGNQSNPVDYREVRLDWDRLIGEDGKGDEIMLGRALPVFQVCQGAIGVGLAEAACQATLKHITGAGFQHTGTKLSDLSNLRAAIAEMRVETDKARAYLASVLDAAENGSGDAMLALLAVKASSAETAIRTTDLAMRTCGGAAFSRHLGLERVFRDARAAVVMSPTTDHLREFIGRALCGMPMFG